MSRTAKFTLMGSLFTTTLIVWGVHYMQQSERDTMYQGVLRDDERRKQKMKQREEDLQQSLEKRELYERVQSVSNPAPGPTSSR
ncbi:uncharacterized protein BXZ73DRAFT_42330 [Epithele typhae]|uniref:uncharacterized protein n=1 Tax=Epithele typhae TaxID=378194 RepID=UPI002008649A|nr:uncharacterized protein BXZ73DRAFT_42330 [Epithele typhae]KAH9940868.1 hypothetical protein BXZ73DRAFT_42330 [Epithele typhae]